MRAQARRLLVRNFVRHFLTPGPTFMNASRCYLEVDTECTSANTAKQRGWQLTQEEDVKAEMQRQLRAIDKAADMDDQWVYDRWRAIANANIFDYVTINPETGVVDFTNLDPAKLTPEQQLAIEEIKLDKFGRVTHLKLASKNQAVANVARARQMIDGKRDASAVDLAQRITERMHNAAKRVPVLGRIFENDTGDMA